jgi:hypothetical protein
LEPQLEEVLLRLGSSSAEAEGGQVLVAVATAQLQHATQGGWQMWAVVLLGTGWWQRSGW